MSGLERNEETLTHQIGDIIGIGTASDGIPGYGVDMTPEEH